MRVLPLTATVLLDTQHDAAVAVGWPALLALLQREMAVRRLAARDALRADDARVADVDNIRIPDVEPDAKAGQEDRRRD